MNGKAKFSFPSLLRPFPKEFHGSYFPEKTKRENTIDLDRSESSQRGQNLFSFQNNSLRNFSITPFRFMTQPFLFRSIEKISRKI